MRRHLVSTAALAVFAAVFFPCVPLGATALPFSGSVSGSAAENPQGRCAPFITVSASGSGSSNLLGSFVDTQSHCTTSLTTFDDGMFTLTSQSHAGDSLSGIYLGTAHVGSGGVLDFSATLTVNGGSGSFADMAGTLNSSGTLNAAGAFTASFAGSVTATPEPGAFLLVGAGLAIFACLRISKRPASTRSQ